jgi:tRNA G18 (ribose-2'-O)-methylase SpoU
VSIRIDITDVADPRLGDFRDLKRADRRPDRPGGRGLVIAEGTVVVRRMIDSAYPLRALLGVTRRYDEIRGDLADCPVPYYVADAETMAEVVGFHLNRGVLATADRVAFPDAAGLLSAARRVAVLEGVGDHENIGAIFRNAAALGIDAVLLAAGCADPLYRRSVRVSMGNVLAVPFAPIPPLADGGAELLRSKGFRIVALTPRVDAVPITVAADLTAGAVRCAANGGDTGCDQGPDAVCWSRVAIVLGSEGPGLSEGALAAADVLARIPMAHGVDSLNVATAGAIAFAALAR